MSKLPCFGRVNAVELLDDPALSSADACTTMREQAVVNRWLGGAHATLAHALPLLLACTADPVRVLDAGCGGGDLSRRLVDAARRSGQRIEITALDLHKQVIACAREWSAEYPEIHCVIGDVLRPPFPPAAFDIVLLSTLLHHLPPEQIILLLRTARALCRGSVIAADLRRSPLSYAGFCAFARLMRFSPITLHDGLASLRRAYTPEELADLANRAGLRQWTLTRHWVSRMPLVYVGGCALVFHAAGYGVMVSVPPGTTDNSPPIYWWG